jgi:hypothetical protein
MMAVLKTGVAVSLAPRRCNSCGSTAFPTDFPFALDRVDIQWIAEGSGSQIGDAVDVYVWEDADGNPANGAAFLFWFSGKQTRSLKKARVKTNRISITGGDNTAVSEIPYGRTKEPHPMKIAHHPDTHQPITATADAPPQAICPHCGGPVTLRHRHRVDGTAVYFWRHLNNQSRECSSRTHAAQLKSGPSTTLPKARRRR